MSIHNHFLAVLHSTNPANAVLGQAGRLDALRETITVLALTGQGYQNPPRRRSASNQLRGSGSSLMPIWSHASYAALTSQNLVPTRSSDTTKSYLSFLTGSTEQRR
ncbi:hypothetical protein SUNI508_03716 [Seiridium unicorne]|uniref:Uncharacterized protein n=1 Tax=Seiridium unicorne TaxID=138068 RepID=A0ABR2VC99_9PEZI